MKNSSNPNATAALAERDILYFRHRYQNRVFQSVMAHFAVRAERDGLTKSQVALALSKDPAQISRWFAGPSNWTLETVSDLLLAMEAEMSDQIWPFHEADESNKTVSSSSPKTTLVVRNSDAGSSLPRLRAVR